MKVTTSEEWKKLAGRSQKTILKERQEWEKAQVAPTVPVVQPKGGTGPARPLPLPPAAAKGVVAPKATTPTPPATKQMGQQMGQQNQMSSLAAPIPGMPSGPMNPANQAALFQPDATPPGVQTPKTQALDKVRKDLAMVNPATIQTPAEIAKAKQTAALLHGAAQNLDNQASEKALYAGSNWYILLKMAAGISSGCTSNATTGRWFFSLWGNTFPVKDQLKALGFQFFQKVWSTRVDFITPQKRQQLEALGIDTSPLDDPKLNEKPMPQQPKPPVASETPDATLAKMRAGLNEAMNSPGADGKVKSMLSYVDNMIEKLSKDVDEAAKSDFIRNFMKFSAMFHNYSFSNTMLIYIQNKNATHVAGHKKWMELGRQVVDWKAGITIIAPRMKKREFSDEQLSTMPTDKANKLRNDPGSYVYFVATTVYDITATQPMQGAKDVFTPTEWRKDPNERVDEVTALIEAANAWGSSEGIDIQKQEMGSATGGFSANKKIRLNNAFEGINLFSTTVHELAHEVLHWKEGRKSGLNTSKEELRKEKQLREVDAETTAYIVLQHYGFDTADSKNYLALWGANSKDLKSRREHIHEAVKTIVNGIDKIMTTRNYDDAEAVGENSPAPNEGIV